MGDIADMMLEGDMCQLCGVILSGEGYPQVCPACQESENVDQFGQPSEQTTPVPVVRRKTKCPHCGKSVWESGLKQHIKAKHR